MNLKVRIYNILSAFTLRPCAGNCQQILPGNLPVPVPAAGQPAGTQPNRLHPELSGVFLSQTLICYYPFLRVRS